MLKFINCNTYEQMSQQCADALVALVQKNPKAKIVVPTGYSPLLTYRLFVQQVLEKQIDTSGITWIKLDEWAGLPPENPATCDYFIRKEILDPLQVKDSQYLAFNALAPDPAQECARIQECLDQLGEIDVSIVGVGRNGHVGLNEPGQTIPLGPHTMDLTPKTKEHAMLKEAGEQQVTQGLTLGMDNILSAKTLFVLATGGEKQLPFRQMESGVLSLENPVSLLNLHGNGFCYVDQCVRRMDNA